MPDEPLNTVHPLAPTDHVALGPDATEDTAPGAEGGTAMEGASGANVNRTANASGSGNFIIVFIVIPLFLEAESIGRV